MKIESIDIEKLNHDPNNARTHDTKNIEAIKGSLAKFGQQKPIVVTKDNIVIAGNGTLDAAKALGWSKLNIVRSELEGFNAAAYALADNRTAELAAWDEEILGKTLQALREDDFPIEDIGFDLSEIAEPVKDGLIDEDEVPTVDDNPFEVELGQIWRLGNHRLMCGDSTDKAQVELLMNGEKADMVFTDPPYGMAAVETSSVLSKRYKPIQGDLTPDIAKKCFVLYSDIPGIWWGANYYGAVLSDATKWLVWDKNNGGSDQMDCELAWTNLKGVTRQFTLVSEKTGRIHPTQKPIALVEWAFQFVENTNVLDLFLGSGSTLIACEKTNRKCYGMEIDPHYCSVIIKRWQDYTGQKAERLSAKT